MDAGVHACTVLANVLHEVFGFTAPKMATSCGPMAHNSRHAPTLNPPPDGHIFHVTQNRGQSDVRNHGISASLLSHVTLSCCCCCCCATRASIEGFGTRLKWRITEPSGA
eukprot:364060-Chlamydomonas_euryale.AAC.1